MIKQNYEYFNPDFHSPQLTTSPKRIEQIKSVKENFTVFKPKICICMSDTPNIHAYSKLSEYINKAYAYKHNYDFIMFSEKMTDRAPQWCKIKVINKLLNNLDENKNKFNYDYDYLFWIDADAFFNDFDIKLESIIENEKDKDLIICDDIVNSGKPNTVNSGTFFVKCSDKSKKLFTEIWNYDGPYLFDYFHEQTIIEQLMVKPEYKNCISVKEGNLFNTEINNFLAGKIDHKLFIIHLMAMPFDFRVKYMTEWIEKNLKV